MLLKFLEATNYYVKDADATNIHIVQALNVSHKGWITGKKGNYYELATRNNKLAYSL